MRVGTYAVNGFCDGSRLSGMSDCLSAHRSQHGAVSLPCGFTLPGSSGDNSADLHLPYTQPREGNAFCWTVWQPRQSAIAGLNALP